jgi:hypothetical protein
MTQPGTAPNGMLFVFLPGTGGTPACCQLLLRQAVALGYHAIGLTYNNETAVGDRCLDNLACYGAVRQNVFNATEPSRWIALPADDGVQQRLAALLAYLARHYPAEGWARFLTGTVPQYASIVVGGHSQGGGEAAFAGSVQRVAGVITLSSPPDTDSSLRPATWVAGVPNGRTPLARYIAFVHVGDPFYPRIAADWAGMQLASLGPPVLVDATPAPYGHSHQLLSAARQPLVPLAAHDATAVDSATPLCPGGVPQYAPVWRTMLQVAGGLPVTASAAGCAGAG